MDHATPSTLDGRQQGPLTSQLPSANPSQSCNVVTIPHPDPNSNATGIAITKLEDILASVQDALRQREEMFIPYLARPTSASQAADAPGRAARSRTPRAVVRFPGHNVAEATKFTRLMLILRMSLGALTTGTVITKRQREHRNIYYQNPNLFKRQSVVDNLVDGLAYTLGLGREDLAIVAASKGLVAGPLSLRMRDSFDADPSVVDASLGGTVGSLMGVLIPSARSVSQIDFGPASWILVIEKEASRYSLPAWSWRLNSAGNLPYPGDGKVLGNFKVRSRCSHYGNQFPLSGDSPGTPTNLLTIEQGKGFPDLNTKQFVHLLHDARPEIPIYALVDFDCYGVHIMRCYSHGSRQHAHEKGVTVTSLQWLGIKSGDLGPQHSLLPNGNQETSPKDGDPDETPRMRSRPHSFTKLGSASRRRRCVFSDLGASSVLTEHDRKRAINMIKDINEDGNAHDMECRRELQVMLFLGVTVEIQAVDDAGDISKWLDEHLVV
ncbi:Meiotic recombination protein rec12 [Colletotrichum chlorophyti]|uniref:DNA topoisomerase (ATP-hydrolyzing) n=1 Tax=Colletotrichum chlorophyti TaxID=708187 RepID=A0A1Q8RRC4_9PEZI|nr:Meiotic recombination protein rec12 [Colletotrichum chlorophyti]